MTHPSSVEPFLYVGGDPAIDLINTVDWTARGPEAERLESFEQLTRWAAGAGVIALLAAYALQVRSTLHDLFGAIARGEPAETELTRFNRLLGEALAGLEVGPGEGAGAGYRWHWQEEGSNPRALVWRVLWSAASLLRSDEIGKVRVCGGDDCGWMYVDRSRNGLRRWCQMRTCGTREKTRRRRVSGTAT